MSKEDSKTLVAELSWAGKAYPREDYPQTVQGSLSTEAVGNGVEKHLADELTQGLHGTPEGCIICFERIHAGVVAESNVIGKSLVGNDAAYQPYRSGY